MFPAIVVTGCAQTSQSTLSLDNDANGKDIEVQIGQVLELTLFEGGDPYLEPEISSDALAFVASRALERGDLPGGPPRQFEFRGVQEGVSEVTIPRATSPGFQFTAHVHR